MTTVYTGTFTPGTNPADVERAALAALPRPPDGFWYVLPNEFKVMYRTFTLTTQEEAAFETAVAGAAADPNAPWRIQDELLGKAAAALAGNITFLGIASPTNAQNAAQIKALTRQVNAIIRLFIGQLDSTSGT